MDLAEQTSTKMDSVRIGERVFIPFISNQEIEQVVKGRAEQISLLCKERSVEPVFIVVLNGAFIYAADFLRFVHQDMVCFVEFVKLSSYKGTKTEGKVYNHLSLKYDIKDKWVFILEDIVDTGTTMNYLVQELKKMEPAHIQLLPLIFKPEALRFDLGKVEACFEIPDKFIVGYGLDCDGVGRHLTDIYRLADPGV